MLPKQLLQATCLLLLSASVFGRTILNEEIAATIAAAEPMASIQQVHPSAVNCYKQFGPEGCLWNTTCNAQISGCLLCERRNPPNFECAICRPGSYLQGVATCTRCPVGFWCGGNHDREACSEGFTTPSAGRWDPSQCSTCVAGFGGSGCSPCGAGQFKPLVGTDTCSYCPDGFVSNAVVGATECVNSATCPTGTTADTTKKSCVCPAGSAAALPFSAAKPCAACDSGTVASSLNDPTAIGATTCVTCPANSRPNTAGEGNDDTLPAGSTCVCNFGFLPNGANPSKCVAKDLQCPPSPVTGLTLGGCVAPGAPAPGTPGGPGGPPGGPGGRDHHEQEWGHWHSKHGKHGHHHDEDEEEYSKYEAEEEEYYHGKDEYLNH